MVRNACQAGRALVNRYRARFERGNSLFASDRGKLPGEFIERVATLEIVEQLTGARSQRTRACRQESPGRCESPGSSWAWSFPRPVCRRPIFCVPDYDSLNHDAADAGRGRWKTRGVTKG